MFELTASEPISERCRSIKIIRQIEWNHVSVEWQAEDIDEFEHFGFNYAD